MRTGEECLSPDPESTYVIFQRLADRPVPKFLKIAPPDSRRIGLPVDWPARALVHNTATLRQKMSQALFDELEIPRPELNTPKGGQRSTPIDGPHDHPRF